MITKYYVKVTPQQRKLAFTVIRHPDWTAAQCLEAAGYALSTQRKKPGSTIAGMGTQAAIVEELDKVGATSELAAKRLREALDYQKVQRLVVSGGKGCPSTVEAYTDIDNAGRLAAIDQLAKLRGWVSSNPQIVVQIVNVMETVGLKYVPMDRMGDYLRDVGTSFGESNGRR